MITFDDVTVTLPGRDEPVLRDVTLSLGEGELCLVVGDTGSGKTTLLRCVNGLVPHFSGGTLAGRVSVDGRDTRTHRPRDLADLVGWVGQDPVAGFVTDRVEDELAFGMESLGLDPATMRRRVEETLDLLGLADVRDRSLLSLSAGQQQRVAIGAVLGAHPRVLVLDEPTSALDPPAAEDVLAALTRLVHDLGLTVVVAEHRLERIAQHADRVVLLPGNGAPLVCGTAAEVLGHGPVGPPVVQLARLLGWTPVPLSVRDARRLAGPLRERLAHRDPPSGGSQTAGALLLRLDRVEVRRGGAPALRRVGLAVHTGEIVALMGRNGAGKSTLLETVAGLHAVTGGTVDVTGLGDPHRRPAAEVVGRVGLVPHQPADLLYARTVAAECAQSDRDGALAAGSTAAVLERLAPGLLTRDAEDHPRDLSEGQRLLLALAVVLACAPPLLLLDEPTRGLDTGGKDRLIAILRELALRGHAVVLATHDVELAAALAHRTLVLADGEVIADGPSRAIVTASPAFAPQIAKVLSPQALLTVREVADALEATV